MEELDNKKIIVRTKPVEKLTGLVQLRRQGIRGSTVVLHWNSVLWKSAKTFFFV